jgi:hypothetical protein
MEKVRAMKKTPLFEYELPATPKKRAMGLLQVTNRPAKLRPSV